MNSRLTKLRIVMTQEKVDAVLISSTPNIIYLTNFNHFVPEEREAFLLITKKRAYILTDKRYTHAVEKYIKDFELFEIGYECSFSELIQEVIEKENIKRLGIEEDNLTYLEYKKISPFISASKHFDLTSLRINKSNDELKAIEKACVIGDRVFANILPKLEVNITENEVASLMETDIKRHHGALAFDSIVAFGENGAFVHHKTGHKKLEKNMSILFDFGVKYENYCSDMSRTVFFGKATVEEKKVYEVVRRAQELANDYIRKLLKNGQAIHGANVDKVAREYIIEQGYESFPHALGHGVGLKVHEAPTMRPPSKSILENGMAFTNEPGVYIPHKFGIRIEDVYVIKNNMLVEFTKASRALLEIK